MPKVRIHILNASDKDTKEVRIQKLEDKVKPPGKVEKAKRWVKQLNEPIVYPSLNE